MNKEQKYRAMSTNFKKFLMESYALDSEKIKFIDSMWEKFSKYCKENSEKIAQKILQKAEYKFKIEDLKINITIVNYGIALGGYNRKTKTLTITLYRAFENIIKNIKYFEDLTNNDKNVIYKRINSIFGNFASGDSKWHYKAAQFYNEVQTVFEHEIAHYYDSITYGQGYEKHTDVLSKIQHKIKNKEKKYELYYNMPHEIDAYFMSSLKQLLDTEGTKYDSFGDFFSKFWTYFNPYENLTPQNKKRVIKRLYLYYNELKINDDDM